MEKEEKYFRWAYSLQTELAKKLLAETNASLIAPNDWPAGQEWEDLNGSSRSIFLRQARDLAGIDHTEFLEPIRSGEIDVEDLYGTDKPK